MKRLLMLLPRLRLRRPQRPRRPVLMSSGAVMAGIATVAMAGYHTNGFGLDNQDGGARMARHAATAALTAGFHGITLPDLLVVLPGGLTHREISKLGAIKGVRKLISFDGAGITIGNQTATVIGVNPGQFRSWVPLSTASDQSLWTRLAAGDFIADTSSAVRLNLSPDAQYELVGGANVQAVFGGSGQLGISGVDFVVNEAVSRELGLLHEVAALISAPGPSMANLIASVRRVLGPAARLVSLRSTSKLSTQPVSSPDVARHITGYLQLFQASSARYCPSLPWTVLAAIGQIESADGQDVGPSTAGALGPMQFLPSTWSQWGIDGFGPKGTPDIMNPMDAVPSAARYLCAAGASSGTDSGLRAAIYAYNHATWYVNEVMDLAAKYAADYS